MLQLQNIPDAKAKLLNYDPTTFSGVDNSFRFFLKKLKINDFRHISGLEITFDHPVTVITGTNKIGKTSLLLLIAVLFKPNNSATTRNWLLFLRN